MQNKRDNKVVFQYFPESDMLYIKLIDGISTESEEVAPYVVLDFDADNRVLGIEIEDASRRMDLSKLEISALPIVNLVFSQQRVDAVAAWKPY